MTDLKNAAKQVILWLFKEALGPVVGVGALFALSTISVTHFLGPLRNKYPLPVWVISVTVAVSLTCVTATSLWGLHQRKELRRLTQKQKDTIYQSHDLEWTLTPAFWMNYQRIGATGGGLLISLA